MRQQKEKDAVVEQVVPEEPKDWPLGNEDSEPRFPVFSEEQRCQLWWVSFQEFSQEHHASQFLQWQRSSYEGSNCRWGHLRSCNQSLIAGGCTDRQQQAGFTSAWQALGQWSVLGSLVTGLEKGQAAVLARWRKIGFARASAGFPSDRFTGLGMAQEF